MSETKHVWKAFMSWEDEKEARWLEQMARDGWHLMNGGIRFQFERGAPADIRYCLDYRDAGKNKGEYFGLFADSGWEHVSDYCSWHYFRSPVASHAPDIYTNVATRVDMYRRLIAVFILLGSTGLIFIANPAVQLGAGKPLWAWLVATAIQLAASSILYYAVWRLYRRIQDLKRREAPYA